MARSKKESDFDIVPKNTSSTQSRNVGRPKDEESEKTRIERGECVRTLIVLPKEIKRALDLDVANQKVDNPSITVSSIIAPLLEEYYKNKNKKK